MDDIIRIRKSEKNSGLLIDEVSGTVKHEIIRKEGGFPGMLIGTLGASVLGNVLTEKGPMRANGR